MADPDDFTANTATTGRFIVNGRTTGNLGTSGDHDWFKGWLYAGHTYVIQQRGDDTGDGTLDDGVVSLFDETGTMQLAVDLDSGIGNPGFFGFGNAYLRFVPETSGYYFVDAGANFGTGTYEIVVAQQADSLARYSQWGGGINATATLLMGDVNNNGTTNGGDIINGNQAGFFSVLNPATREDIVAIAANGNVFVSLNNSDNSGFAAPVLATVGGTASDRLFDINSDIDHRDDLFQIYNGSAFVATGNNTDGLNDFALWGSGFLPSATIRELGFDGNLNSDAIQFSGGNALVALQNASSNGFNAFTTWATGCIGNEQLLDFNGDFRGDLLQIYNGRAYVATSNLVNAFDAFTVVETGVTASDRVGDFNGDFIDDLFQVYNGNMYVSLSNGSVFQGWQQWGSGASANTRLADFNGDHRLDVFQVDAAGNASVALANGTGTGFVPFEVWASNVGPNDRLGLVNGDTLTDVIQLYNGNAYVWESIAVPPV